MGILSRAAQRIEGSVRFLLTGRSPLYSEGWTIASFAKYNQDFIGAYTDVELDIDLFGVWNFVKHAYYSKGPVANVTNNLTFLTGRPRLKFGKPEERAWKKISERRDNRRACNWTRTVRNTYLFNDYASVILDGGSPNVRLRNLQPTSIEKVLSEDDDLMDIKGYLLTNGETLPPEKVVHHQLDTIGNDSRGIPLFHRATMELYYYYALIKDVHSIFHVRARIPTVRKAKEGGIIDVAKEAQRLQKLPPAGTIHVENEGYDWEFPPQYEGTREAKVLAEIFLRGIALAVNLPYSFVSSDWKENNLASSISQDSPIIKLIQDNRGQFDGQIKDTVRGALGDEDADVETEWPPILERDLEKQAKAYATGIDKGAIAPQTMSVKVFGTEDWEAEKKKIDAANEEHQRKWGMGSDWKEKGKEDQEDGQEKEED